ncbi:hypothetical protein CgunFtcFv8_022243 [Champsocephalus gunnari]|uniref:Uncharacterized protein n=1 Tax=Champsocephalus gunnari TaxID=52237 RepID=A0AAN8HSZ2_CHAGU|nr:hypothetical protein CgunFtcFv8_022243 [Champsocephalus gunnari]
MYGLTLGDQGASMLGVIEVKDMQMEGGLWSSCDSWTILCWHWHGATSGAHWTLCPSSAALLSLQRSLSVPKALLRTMASFSLHFHYNSLFTKRHNAPHWLERHSNTTHSRYRQPALSASDRWTNAGLTPPITTRLCSP